MVAEVRKVVEADNRFFLRSDGKVLIFDTNGKFLGKVDQKGEGPSQYRSLTDFIVDTLTHHVEVLDNYSFSVFTFDYTGKLVNHWTHGLLAFKFQKLDSDRYVFYTDKQLVATYPGRFQGVHFKLSLSRHCVVEGFDLLSNQLPSLAHKAST